MQWSQNTNAGSRLVIFIFFEQFILLSIQKQKKKKVRQNSRSEACESNVWACEHVEKVLRHVIHAQGVCLGRSAIDECFRLTATKNHCPAQWHIPI